MSSICPNGAKDHVTRGWPKGGRRVHPVRKASLHPPFPVAAKLGLENETQTAHGTVEEHSLYNWKEWNSNLSSSFSENHLNSLNLSFLRCNIEVVGTDIQ